MEERDPEEEEREEYIEVEVGTNALPPASFGATSAPTSPVTSSLVTRWYGVTERAVDGPDGA
jgi:hypothetical protein